MKPFFDKTLPAYSIGVSTDPLWTVVSNHSLIPFHRSKAGSTTRISANKNFLLGGMPAFKEKTSPWSQARQRHMQNTNPNPASENEVEIDYEDTLARMEKTQNAALKKLNHIRLAFTDQCGILKRLKVEDDYAEGLRFLVKQAVDGVLLSNIAPMFPDVAKLKAAREALKTAGLIKESKKGTAVILQLVTAEA